MQSIKIYVFDSASLTGPLCVLSQFVQGDTGSHTLVTFQSALLAVNPTSCRPHGRLKYYKKCPGIGFL